VKKKIRYAVVGLGHIAQTAVLPAFEHAENSELAALVTGNPKGPSREMEIKRPPVNQAELVGASAPHSS
jgi:predicted dehydrogenase